MDGGPLRGSGCGRACCPRGTDYLARSVPERLPMIPQKAEKLGSIFLATFATGLAAVIAADGMEPPQKLGAALAVTASAALAVAVRVWPQREPVKVKRD
jgi:hypothetical protein